jgi:hypothetical protein
MLGDETGMEEDGYLETEEVEELAATQEYASGEETATKALSLAEGKQAHVKNNRQIDENDDGGNHESVVLEVSSSASSSAGQANLTSRAIVMAASTE